MSATAEVVPCGKDFIRARPLYIPGKATSAVARELGFVESEIVKLASNENPLGVPLSARQAMEQLAANPSACYPDPDATELKLRLRARYGVDAGWITVGNGSSEIIEMAARVFAGPGDSVVISQYAFASYHIAAAGAGAESVIVPASGFGHDLAAMLRAIDRRTRLIYIANPNNPTGTFIARDEICDFLDAVPPDVAVLLDEAYSEYLPDECQGSPAGLVGRYPNLIVTRTFSKAYGLAALRIGYCFAQQQMTALLNRVRPVFNTNCFAQAAAAAALQDTEFVARSRAMNDAGKKRLCGEFARLALPYVRSQGNFILVNVGDGAAVSKALLSRAVIVRPMASYGLSEWIRVTVGLSEQNDRFLSTLRAILRSAPSIRNTIAEVE
jgi:histidinol-phosphate aminotransferase